MCLIDETMVTAHCFNIIKTPKNNVNTKLLVDFKDISRAKRKEVVMALTLMLILQLNVFIVSIYTLCFVILNNNFFTYLGVNLVIV